MDIRHVHTIGINWMGREYIICSCEKEILRNFFNIMHSLRGSKPLSREATYRNYALCAHIRSLVIFYLTFHLLKGEGGGNLKNLKNLKNLTMDLAETHINI